MSKLFRMCALAALLIGSNVAIADEDNLTNPPTPICSAGDFLWEQTVDVTNLDSRGLPIVDVLLVRNTSTSFIIPGPYPAEFASTVTLSVGDAVAWDGYVGRSTTGEQPDERYKLVFFKNGSLVASTDWTGAGAADDGVTTGWESDFWRGPLDQNILLPDGTDEIRIIHWSDGSLGTGDTSTPNSVIPSSICISSGSEGTVSRLGDRVWEDLDGDGIQDCTDGGAGDPGNPADGVIGNAGDSGVECGAGVPGVTVELYEEVGGVCNVSAGPSVMTDSNGFYLFDNLAPGDYCVRFDRTTIPAGFCAAGEPVFTLRDQGDDAIDSDADPGTGNTASVNVAAGGANLTLDAGIFCQETVARLGDRVWEDRNADGIQDCVDGGAMDPMSPADGIVGNAGDSGTECDAGIAGVDVVLYENPDGDPACNNGGEVIVDTTFTDDFGFYVFDNLDPNKNYCVNFDRASAGVALLCNAIIGDATFSPEGAGSDTTIDSNADIASGRTGNIQSDDFNLSWDAGIYCPAKIGDRLVEDVNGDGIQNDPEPVGVGDQIVELLECENGVPGNVIRTTTTANNGMYMFNPLPPGEYAVRFTNPVDTVFIPMSPGNNDADNCDTDLNGETQCINLSANEYNDRVDACVYQPPSAGLGDFVFEDKNANGVQDGGEPGIVGVPVTLLTPGTNGACGTPGQVELFDTVTGLNGEYAFMNLAGGAYCVEFDKSAVTCDYGTAAYSPADATLDSDDSDVNPATNQTGVITLPDGVFDPTWDAGIYCPAKIGDTVWEDANGDGIQDDVPNTETGSQGVTVNLLDCTGAPVADLNGDSTLFTDGSGMYMFNVVPGDYIIEFVAPVDRIFTTENPAGSTDANDSDANAVSGRTSCITVPSNVFDDTWDAGLVLPPDCGIAVEKSCEIVQPAPGPFSCSGKVNRLTMIYDGSLGALINVTAHIGDTDQPTLPVQINGNEVTVSGYQAAGAPNDVVWVLSAANGSGESTFHLSCSDDEMDGETDDASFPNDCGRPEGDGKGNDAGVNLWLLEGMKTDEGEILDCTPAAPVSNSECVFQQQIASCASLPDKPDSIQFQYTGGGCSAENNGQDADKTDCIGSIDPNLAVTASFPGGTATVQPGGTFTIPRDGSVTMLTLSNSGGSETITFHTSCSQPLATGDVFFSLTLVGLAGNGLGTDVTYGYLIENTGLAAIDGIRVMDNKLGELATGLSLNPGASTTVTANAFISSTTTNTVTVTSDNNASCIAVDTATVTVLAPPPCSVSSNPKEIKDDAVKFELQNTGSAQSARLDTLTLNFPVEFGTIKEVKLDGTIYKSSDSPLVINSGDTINVGDWTEDNASKRDLDPGEERTLEIKFSNDYKDAEQSDFSGSATFEQGCSVSL